MLKGLEAGKSFCLLTPLRFDDSDIVDPELRQRVVLVANEASLPDHVEPGKIYIVKTKTLPHRVFVGLIAYSMRKGLVPVGAGDGFLSAAINQIQTSIVADYSLVRYQKPTSFFCHQFLVLLPE